MHASHEQAPPTDPGSRRGKVVAMALALLTMALATVAIIVSRPQEAQAQGLPEWAELTGTCADGVATFSVSMPNPRESAFAFEFQLSALDVGGGVEFGETNLEPAAVFTHTFAPVTAPAGVWRVYISELPDYLPVGQSNAVSDPCDTTSTTDETTTDESTTDESTTDESTTDESTTDETTTDESTDETTTDDFAFPDVTTTTDPGIAPAASTTGGGGLASTGVAVVVLLGGAAVLLFNGIGLTRITRRGWGTEDES